MRFINSIFMLLCAVCAVISAYFIGHGIVVGGSWPWLTAGALIVASIVFGFVYFRLAKNESWGTEHEGHAHH